MAVWRKLIWAGLVPVLVALGFSYAGSLHPAGDSLAVFRSLLMVLAALLGLALLRAGWRRMAVVLVAVLGFAALPTLAGLIPLRAPGNAALTVYQKNLFNAPKPPVGEAADIGAVQPDFVTLQELGRRGGDLLKAVQVTHPTQLVCVSARRNVALASRFPGVPGREICGDGFAARQVQTPQGRVWIVSIHLHWPWPHGQARQLDRLVPLLEKLDGPVIIGGDFNMVPASHALRRLAAAARVRRAGHVRGSYDLLGVWPIAIDHVFAPGGGVTELRGKFQSDHRGLLARVSL